MVKELIVEKRIHHVLFTPLNNYTGKLLDIINKNEILCYFCRVLVQDFYQAMESLGSLTGITITCFRVASANRGFCANTILSKHTKLQVYICCSASDTSNYYFLVFISCLSFSK